MCLFVMCVVKLNLHNTHTYWHHSVWYGVSNGPTNTLMLMLLHETLRQRHCIIVSELFHALAWNISPLPCHSAVADESVHPGECCTQITSSTCCWPHRRAVAPSNVIIMTGDRDHNHGKKILLAWNVNTLDLILWIFNRWQQERDKRVCLWWVNGPVWPILRWWW